MNVGAPSPCWHPSATAARWCCCSCCGGCLPRGKPQTPPPGTKASPSSVLGPRGTEAAGSYARLRSACGRGHQNRVEARVTKHSSPQTCPSPEFTCSPEPCSPLGSSLSLFLEEEGTSQAIWPRILHFAGDKAMAQGSNVSPGLGGRHGAGPPNPNPAPPPDSAVLASCVADSD